MARGIFGFRRLTSVGPFTYSTEIGGTEDIEEILVDILDEREIDDVREISPEEALEITEEMTNTIYPEGGEVFDTPIGEVSEEQIFRECLTSRWADLWEEGFTQSTTGESGGLEELIIKANGCSGIAEAGPAGISVLASTG